MSETLSAILSTGRRTREVPALFVGLAGDAPRTPPARIALGAIDRVDLGRGDRRAFTRRSADGAELLVVTLPDARLSTTHARMSRLGNAWVLEDLGSKNGTWIGGVRIERKPLVDGDTILVGHTALVYRDRGGEAGDLEEAPRAAAPGLATIQPALAAHFDALVSAAQALVQIEIRGESGTGKELVAKAVHALSNRSGAFAAINCGAIPASLLEGELFGHRKGAYTGALDDRAGIIRSADRGTLFLDEIAELPLAAQATLLRVLQEGEVSPLGADRPVKVDLRVVTATHQDLDEAVTANRFRADLRARLLGMQLQLPPLRERREDLAMLVATLLDRTHKREITFSADAVAAIYRYDWPLNIRELERALAAALAVTRDRIELDHLPIAMREVPTAPDVDLSSLTVEERAQRESLARSIERHDGNLAAVARELGKDRTQIRRWMKRFGLSRDD